MGKCALAIGSGVTIFSFCSVTWNNWLHCPPFLLDINWRGVLIKCLLMGMQKWAMLCIYRMWKSYNFRHQRVFGEKKKEKKKKPKGHVQTGVLSLLLIRWNKWIREQYWFLVLYNNCCFCCAVNRNIKRQKWQMILHKIGQHKKNVTSIFHTMYMMINCL